MIQIQLVIVCNYVCGAWYHLRSASIAKRKISNKEGDIEFYRQKNAAANFFISQLLPRAAAYGLAVTQGAEVGVELESNFFTKQG